MCISCNTTGQRCRCECYADDIILGAIGYPFCISCEHPLDVHDDMKSGKHPVPKRRTKAAAVPASEPIPGMPQPVYMEMR